MLYTFSFKGQGLDWTRKIRASSRNEAAEFIWQEMPEPARKTTTPQLLVQNIIEEEKEEEKL